MMSSSGMRIKGHLIRDKVERLSIRNSSPALNLLLVLVALIVHAIYITNHLWNHRVSHFLTTFRHNTRFFSSHPNLHDSSLLQANDNTDVTENGHVLPKLFIFRRTRKTGSSSMLAELLSQLVPLGYTPLYFQRGEMEIVVRHEYVRHQQRHLLIAEHNRITRRFHPKRLAVIADTIRGGYEQMTSFCRYVLKVPSCDSNLIIACLESEEALSELKYRWANRTSEDDDTYIDLPLSSAHPALSTTIIRTVYPSVTLDVAEYNVRNSACADVDEVRVVYERLYAQLELQVFELKKRMLTIAGYPFEFENNEQEGGTEVEIPIDDMLDAAEGLEREKYNLSPKTTPLDQKRKKRRRRKTGYSDDHLQLRASIQHWTKGKNGQLSLKSRRG